MCVFVYTTHILYLHNLHIILYHVSCFIKKAAHFVFTSEPLKPIFYSPSPPRWIKHVSLCWGKSKLVCLIRVSTGPTSSSPRRTWRTPSPSTTRWPWRRPTIARGPTCSTCARQTGESTSSRRRESLPAGAVTNVNFHFSTNWKQILASAHWERCW